MSKKPKKFIQEFKQFALKGNVLDLAVGVIIGAAFSSITTSLVDNVIMPIISLFTGAVNFEELVFHLGPLLGETAAEVKIGTLLATVLDFLIVAMIVFLMVKGINKLHVKKEETAPEPPKPSKEELLLTEIRDLLKENARVSKDS